MTARKEFWERYNSKKSTHRAMYQDICEFTLSKVLELKKVPFHHFKITSDGVMGGEEYVNFFWNSTTISVVFSRFTDSATVTISSYFLATKKVDVSLTHFYATRRVTA